MTKDQLSGPGPKIQIALQVDKEAAKTCADDGGRAKCDRGVIPMPGVREEAVEGLPRYLQRRDCKALFPSATNTNNKILARTDATDSKINQNLTSQEGGKR